MKKRLNSKQAAAVVSTGCASFVSRQIRSFKEIEFPPIALSLDLTENRIPDFTGFEPKITLETLIVDRNPICSFHGFPSQQMIIHFSAKNTPISELPNFRQLALLAIGSQLETINGVPVSQSELSAISGRAFTEYFFRKVVTKITAAQQDQITRQLSEAVRHGYIADKFPRQLSSIAEAVQSQESDPVTVRAMRLMYILHKDEVAIKELMRWIFCPILANQTVKKSQVVDERLTKQQALINFMTDQLEEFKRNREYKLKQFDTQSEVNLPEQPQIIVSDETRELYEQMVRETAQILIENSEKFELEEEKAKKKNYQGLRAAVIRLLKVGSELSDRELVNLLREHSEEMD
ncbi:hypothetical protein TRFO_07755 [Tritrichomonas foetus]|uniref:Leucine Rich Repeat family protein n=1 Tax=Tritrichomonas foetus TaxID=1144522 RepID=A0A1J4JNS3_9EUKA|nr:hypothetical protein TRFO_07755 [Tritrichomonas foetus]|eukprot:OHT00777.1 hypothetical protein TRFO_07755 [Tritrichomonas foetus]